MRRICSGRGSSTVTPQESSSRTQRAGEKITMASWQLPKRSAAEANSALFAPESEAKKHKAEQGESKSSSKSNVSSQDEELLRLVAKLSLNTAQRGRDLEAATFQTWELPRKHSVITATESAGKDYSAAVQGRGVDHEFGPPHVHKFVAALRTLADLAWPPELLTPSAAEKEVVDSLPRHTAASLASMGVAWKVKNAIDKKDKPKTTKMVIKVTHRLEVQGKQVELGEMIEMLFLNLKFRKSMRGPPPSMLENKVSKKLGSK